jgi:hypothetical protein
MAPLSSKKNTPSAMIEHAQERDAEYGDVSKNDLTGQTATDEYVDNNTSVTVCLLVTDTDTPYCTSIQ